MWKLLLSYPSGQTTCLRRYLIVKINRCRIYWVQLDLHEDHHVLVRLFLEFVHFFPFLAFFLYAEDSHV